MNGSLIEFDGLIEKAKKYGYNTIGLADNKRMHGVLKFYQQCLINNIKPLIGLEVPVKDEFIEELNIVLYAKNNAGYKNLIKISSYLLTVQEIFLLEDLQKYSQDLIAVIETTSGTLTNQIYAQKFDEALRTVRSIKAVFPETYLGMDLNDFAVEMKVAPHLSELAKPIVFNKVMYLEKEDKEASGYLKKILREEEAFSGIFNSGDIDLYFKDTEAMDKSFLDYQEVIRNTFEFIDKCNVQIDLANRFLPKYPFVETTAYDKLLELANKGLVRRLKQNKKYTKEIYDEYKERLDFELNIIKTMGYEDYFLIVWDFVLYAKKKGYLVGPGRGSAAGSLVSYVLGIVDVDPLEYDLYFERFLNPERITMPDIDIDFPDDKRDDVIRYVAEKYGKTKVVSVIAFGTFQGKSAIRDVGRVMGASSTVIDELTRNVSDSANSIEQFKKDYPKKYQYFMNNDEINKLITIAAKLNGLCRHMSTHAAGIIITGESILEHSPVQNGLMDMYQTQYEASDLEKIGLLKFDFLGIRNLSMIADTIDLVKETENIDIDIYKIPLDDEKTFALLKDVNTLGIFQLESQGMMKLLRDMQLDNFEDIATCISLFRPGPMENIPTFLKRRKHEERIEYLDMGLMPILKQTNGIIVYQEQIMKIANKFAGYSLGEADVLRRAVSKKKRDILMHERKKFVKGVVSQGYSEDLGNELYDYIVKFANYGFNKSHAIAYSMVAYWMAYLKANHPANFLSVLLNSQVGSQTGTQRYKKECRRLGIKILPPRINKSKNIYYFESGNLRFPYKGIKGVGNVAANKIIALQEEKPIESFIEFAARAKDININVIEAMIYVGVFDDFGINRKTLIDNLERVRTFVQFDFSEANYKFVVSEEYDFAFLQSKEKELLGINIDYYVINRFEEQIANNNLKMVSDVLEYQIGMVDFVGVIQNIREITAKNNQKMAFMEIEDEFSSINAVMFSNQYLRYKDLLENGKVYQVYGKKDIRNNQQQIIINDIKIMG